MKLGLYSVTYLGLWYRGKELTLPEMIGKGQGLRLRRDRDRRQAAARQPARLADGALPRTALACRRRGDRHLRRGGQQRLQQPRARGPRGADLLRPRADPHGGRPRRAPVLRVFLAWWGVTRHPQLATYDIAEGYWPIVHAKFSTEEIWGWCRQALVECARYACDAGVTLALQNHKPLIDNHHDLLRMIREVDSPGLKACLDAPLMPDRSTAGIRAGARAVGSLQALSHFGGEFQRCPMGRSAASSATTGPSAKTRTATTPTSPAS